MKKQAMTRGELLNLLTTEAQKYRDEALVSVERNKHMNNLSLKDISKLNTESDQYRRDITDINKKLDKILEKLK